MESKNNNINKVTSKDVIADVSIGVSMSETYVGPTTQNKGGVFVDSQMRSIGGPTLKYTCFDVTLMQNQPRGAIGGMDQKTLSMLQYESDSDKSQSEDENFFVDSTGVVQQDRMTSDDNHEEFPSNTSAILVTMADASTILEQLMNLTNLVEGLVTYQVRQDCIIIQLLGNNGKSNQTAERYAEEAQKDITFKQGEGSNNLKTIKIAENQSKYIDRFESIIQERTIHVSSNGFIPTDQLKTFIEGTIKDKYEGSSKSSFAYSKPYSRRINSLKIPIGYQHLKLQQFDGKGNPKQHVTHFVETCSNARMEGGLLVKQFVQSLKGNVFDQYIDLTPGLVDSQDQLETKFLNCFYSTRRTVSMLELSHTNK